MEGGEMKVVKCPVCEMSYVPDIPDNVLEHRKYHDRVVNGLPVRSAKSDHIVWTQGELQITVVNQLSPLAQRRRAEKVASLANRETNYDIGIYHANDPLSERNVHVFLLYSKNRAIGLLVSRRCKHIWRAHWSEIDDGGKPEKLINQHPMWSINMVWILQRHRCARLGRTIVDVAVAHFGLTLKTIGWYTPFTESGKALARKCCPEVIYIAK